MSGEGGSSTVWVGNLAWDVSEQELGDAFSRVGTVVEVRIITNKQTGKSKGYAYVEMIDSDAKERAIEEMRDFILGGRPLRTDHAAGKSRSNRTQVYQHGFELASNGIRY